MAFPQAQLPLYVGLAAGGDPVSPATWNFTDITSDVRTASGVTIQAGRQDESELVDATRVSLTLDDRDGRYSRVNPLSDLYGLLDKGTPIEVRVTRIVDTFTRSTSGGWGTEPNSGLTWAHTSSSLWTTTGSVGQYTAATANLADFALMPTAAGRDVDITSTASVPAVMTGASWVHATVVRRVDGNNFYRLHCEFTTGGTISVKIARVLAGVSSDLTSAVATGIAYVAGTRICSHVRAVGPTLQIRCWLESGTEPTTWQAQVDDTAVQGTSLGVYEWRFAGNTNAGSLIVSVDNFRADVVRATTPVPEWPVRWDMSGNNVTSPITGGGILRRLAQGQSQVSSPIYQQLSAQAGCAYWPLEDGSSSAGASNVIAGGQRALGPGVTFGSSDCPPGASSAATLATGGASYIQGRVTTWTVPQDGYAEMAYFRLPTLSASGAPILGNRLMTANAVGTVVRWVIYATSTGFYIEGYASDGTLTVNTGSFAYTLDPSQWFALQLETQESGGTVNWALIWHHIGSTSSLAATGSYAGTADRITAAALCAPVDGTLISHWWIGDDLLPFVDATFMLVSAGYAGETAAARMARLFAQADIPFTLLGTAASTAPMGAQKSGTPLELARDCEAADQGVLVERGAGLGYVTRVFKYNQTPVMALDFATGQIAAPPEPTDDDQRLRNRIVLTRTSGGQVTVQDAASIAKSGVYEDQVEVNVETDDVLAQHAAWRLHLGTIDELRWPKISLNLARNPSLIPFWCSVRVGSRITIANPPSAVATGDTLDLIVEGWTETLGPYRWDVELVCSPARPWDVGVYGDTVKRYQTATLALAEDLTLTETIWDITADHTGDCITQTNLPVDVVVGGERCTVTAAGAVSGTGPYTQQITCTRSVNGIVKTHSTGEPIRIADPVRYAL